MDACALDVASTPTSLNTPVAPPWKSKNAPPKLGNTALSPDAVFHRPSCPPALDHAMRARASRCNTTAIPSAPPFNGAVSASVKSSEKGAAKLMVLGAHAAPARPTAEGVSCSAEATQEEAEETFTQERKSAGEVAHAVS
jgi:hypothetical protein